MRLGRDADSGCERTFATFHLSHEDLDPDAVTVDMGLQPSRTQRRGHPRNPLAQRPVIARFGLWSLTSKDRLHSRDVRDHVDWLLDQLEPVAAAIERYQASGCKSDISCFWTLGRSRGGPRLSPDGMRRMARLSIQIEFDIYF
jgi:hypothetical protein